MNNLTFILKLLRVKQWVKNSFIFFPLLFSGYLFYPEPLKNCVLTFIGFCLISSSLYVFNDFKDKDKDRLHPKKANRPLVKSNIHPAIIFSLILKFMAAGLFICNFVD